MPDILAQTLRVASSRGTFTVTNTPEVIAFPASALEMRDGLDATGSRLLAMDQGEPAGGEYREDWVLDLATEPGEYSFVRVVVRGKHVPTVNPLVGSTAQYQPAIAGVRRGILVGLAASPADDVQDFTADPADGLPWTADKVNAQRWGWWLNAFLIPPSQFDLSTEAWALEYRLELWVPETTPGPEPDTTHELGPYTMEVLEDAARYSGGR